MATKKNYANHRDSCLLPFYIFNTFAKSFSTTHFTTMNIEDKHQDLLITIESPISGVYKKHPELKDKNVIKALDALITYYRYIRKGNEVHPNNLNELENLVYQVVMASIELRSEFIDESELYLPAVRKIHKSAKRWSKRNGVRGYLDFIQNFV